MGPASWFSSLFACHSLCQEALFALKDTNESVRRRRN